MFLFYSLVGLTAVFLTGLPDSQIIGELSRLFTTYGFQTGTIVLLIITLTNVFKKKIIKGAEGFAESTGLDKAIVTQNIQYIPFGISFILNLFYMLAIVKFRFALVDFKEVTAATVQCFLLSVGLYELLKKRLEAYAARRNTVKNNQQVKLPSKTPEAKEENL
jgi:hypothetical protein